MYKNNSALTFHLDRGIVPFSVQRSDNKQRTQGIKPGRVTQSVGRTRPNLNIKNICEFIFLEDGQFFSRSFPSNVG